MQRSATMLSRSLMAARGFCTSNSDKIVASVLFERLPVVIPKIDPVVYAFQEFSFRWGQQYRRQYPDDFLKKSDARGKGDYQIDYVPAPRVTEADKTNDRRSLQRALDRRLYLLLYSNAFGVPDGKPVWHFPEKVYESEETLRKCAECALQSVIGDLSHTYFVGNAPMGHMVMQPTEEVQDLQSLKVQVQVRVVRPFSTEILGYKDMGPKLCMGTGTRVNQYRAVTSGSGWYGTNRYQMKNDTHNSIFHTHSKYCPVSPHTSRISKLIQNTNYNDIL